MKRERGPGKPVFSSRSGLWSLVPYLLLGMLLGWVATPAVATAACLAAMLMLVPTQRREELPQLPSFATLAGLVAFLAWIVTRGTFSWDEREALSSAYDSLARSLREGSVEVRREDIQWEAWSVGGRTFMYFGPFPALLRMLPDALLPERYGLWSRLSGFLAVVLCLGAVVAITRRQLGENEQLGARGRTLLFFATVAAVGLGSVLLLLASVANLYHEAILWGLCAALWGVFFALGVLRDDAGAWRSLALLSVAAGVAFLSRVTFGLPLYALVSGLALRWLLLQVKRERQPLFTSAGRVALALLPAVAPGSSTSGTTTRASARRSSSRPSPRMSPARSGRGGQPFHWSPRPERGPGYFRISPWRLSPRVPFLSPNPRGFRPELYRELTHCSSRRCSSSPRCTGPRCRALSQATGRAREVNFSVSAGSRPRRRACSSPRTTASYRFTAEFLPLGIWLLADLRRAGAERGAKRLLSPAVFAAAVALSVVATMPRRARLPEPVVGLPGEVPPAPVAHFEAMDDASAWRVRPGGVALSSCAG